MHRAKSVVKVCKALISCGDSWIMVRPTLGHILKIVRPIPIMRHVISQSHTALKLCLTAGNKCGSEKEQVWCLLVADQFCLEKVRC